MIDKLIIEKKKQLSHKGYIQFNDSELLKLSKEDINQIENSFKGFGLLKLPPKEIIFFKWLEKNDGEVWNDLWDDDEFPYLISIDFLSHFIDNENGFPICDLENEDNYWFCLKHIKPKGKQYFEEINFKLNNNQKLNIEELLLFEIVQNSIDIWHFSYKFKINISKAKEMVSEMHKNDVLVHLTDREDLVKYIDF